MYRTLKENDMKELLFRGRFKVNKFRWNGAPRELEFIESKTHHISAIEFNNNGDLSHVVIPYKDTCITLFPDYFIIFDIQQYTGIKDKNGVKIFEGDIIRTVPIIASDKVGDYEFNVSVYWSGNSWIANGSLSSRWSCIYEVVGNIYDNPDLIK